MVHKLHKRTVPALPETAQGGSSTSASCESDAGAGAVQLLPIANESSHSGLSSSATVWPLLLCLQVFILPTIRINKAQYRGKLAVTEVLRAICAGFVEGNRPSACNRVRGAHSEAPS